MRFIVSITIFLVLSCSASAINQELFFEHVTGTGEMPNTSIHGIAKDSMGFIWIGSWHGLYKYDGSNFEVFRHTENTPHAISSNRIRGVITDNDKQLWILTYDKEYLKYNYKLNNFASVKDSVVPNYVTVLLNISLNMLNKTSIIDGYRYIINDNIFSSLHLETGIKKDYIANLKQPGGLEDDHITSFYIDEQSIIWLGTRSGRLYKANTNRKPFNLYHLYNDNAKTEKPLPVRTILCENNNLWLGTNHDGLIRSNALTKSNKNSNINLNEDQVRSIELDGNGNLWIGGVHGLGYIDASTQKYMPVFSKGTPFNQIISVFDLQISKDNNHLWVAVYNKLIKLNLTTKKYKTINLRDIIGLKSIMQIAEGKDEKIWLATEGNGIVSLRINDDATCSDTLIFTTTSTKKISGNLAYALYIDRNNNVWAGTSDGLNYIDTKDLTIKQITDKNGIGDNYIAAITEDKDGNIWASHKKGISKIDPNSFNTTNYSITTNNRNWTFNNGSYFNDPVNNKIYFGASQGYISFDPSKIEDNPYRPNIVFNKLYIEGNEVSPKQTLEGYVVLKKTLALTKEIELSYTNRNFMINVSTIHYEKPEGNRIQYKLDGYDNSWCETKDKSIAYSRLPSGTYTLRAKAISPDGVISPEHVLIVKIRFPWYASTWAITGYILLALIILTLIYREILARERLKNRIMLERINIEKKEEINRDRIEFLTNVSHELRTPLTLITDPIKQLQKSDIAATKRERYWDIVGAQY